MAMADEKLDKDALIRKASKELGVDEKAVRNFVGRNNIDPVAFYEEKLKVTQRKAMRARRLMLGGVTGVVGDFTIGPKEVSS